MRKVFFFLCAIPLVILSQEATIISTPVNPSRLFASPTAEVMHSLDILLSGGGTFGTSEERYFLGLITIGFGDIAEISFTTGSVINELMNRSTIMPASIVKVKLWPEQGFLPACAWYVEKTRWNIEGNYYTRYSFLYLSLSKTLGFLHLHGGVKATDLRAKYGEEGQEVKRSFAGPFFGIEIDANPRTKMIFETTIFEKVNYGEGGIRERDLSVVRGYMAGFRFFLTNWISIDGMVLYRDDFKGIADALIRTGINLAIPLAKTYK